MAGLPKFGTLPKFLPTWLQLLMRMWPKIPAGNLHRIARRRFRGLSPRLWAEGHMKWGLALRGWAPSSPTNLTTRFFNPLIRNENKICSRGALVRRGICFRQVVGSNHAWPNFWIYAPTYGDITLGHVAASGLATWQSLIRCSKGIFQGIFRGIFFF